MTVVGEKPFPFPIVFSLSMCVEEEVMYKSRKKRRLYNVRLFIKSSLLLCIRCDVCSAHKKWGNKCFCIFSQAIVMSSKLPL